MLLCLFGTTASTFVKGPVATMLTFSLVLMGGVMLPGLDEMLKQFDEQQGVVRGGGLFESLYRIPQQMGPQESLPDNPVVKAIYWLDARVFDLLGVMRNVIPNFNYFNTAEYPANGFDVSWQTALLPSLATLLAFILPCILLGYLSLQLRELEAK